MSIEKTIFAAADKMRGSMDAGEYKHIALGLLFLRYVSVAFQRLHDKLAADEYSDPEDRDEYLAENIFWVPEKARWSFISKNFKNPEVGVMIDNAMREIEAENPTLKGALPKVFGKESLDKAMLERVAPDQILDSHSDHPVIPCLGGRYGGQRWENRILLSCVIVPCGLSRRAARIPRRRGGCVFRSSS